jgi:hypothetical protein
MNCHAAGDYKALYDSLSLSLSLSLCNPHKTYRTWKMYYCSVKNCLLKTSLWTYFFKSFFLNLFFSWTLQNAICTYHIMYIQRVEFTYCTTLFSKKKIIKNDSDEKYTESSKRECPKRKRSPPTRRRIRVRPRSKTFNLYNNNLYLYAFKQTWTNIGTCTSGMKEAFLACEHMVGMVILCIFVNCRF